MLRAFRTPGVADLMEVPYQMMFVGAVSFVVGGGGVTPYGSTCF
jgi:hypothetical protein